MLKKTIIIILLATSCSIFIKKNFREHLDAAENAEKKQDYISAINEYEKHINFRKEDRERLPEENPWFYKLMVGELFLKLEKPYEAESAFIEALNNKVSPALCAERLRRIAKYFADKRNFEQAFAILKKHRELDPILFDLEIDHIHKMSLNAE